MPFRVPSGVSQIQVNAKTGRRAYPGDTNVIWESFMSGESPNMQQTIYGGETVQLEEPSIDYNDLFDTTTAPNNPYEGQPTYDPNNPYNPNIQVPPPPPSNPALQGTGGIY